MKKIVSVIIILFVCFTHTDAGESIFWDNDSIQEYKGKLGIWIMIDSSTKLYYNARKFSVPVKEVFEINKTYNLTEIIGEYVFIPYSQEYLKTLQLKGKTRSVINTSKDQFIWPLKRIVKLTSVLGLRWGRFHPGLDIPTPTGTPIHAAMGGRIIFSGYAGGYGLRIQIEHRKNFTTTYAHNSVNLVKKGDFVKKGQIIGHVGTTGNSTGSHLHFEIRSSDIPLDPLDFLPDYEGLQVVHTLKNWK